MESSLTTYGEIYVEGDLQSRVTNKKTLNDVLEEIEGKPFDLYVIVNRCIVGTGTYISTTAGLQTEHENGACLGFLDGYLQE